LIHSFIHSSIHSFIHSTLQSFIPLDTENSLEVEFGADNEMMILRVPGAEAQEVSQRKRREDWTSKEYFEYLVTVVDEAGFPKNGDDKSFVATDKLALDAIKMVLLDAGKPLGSGNEKEAFETFEALAALQEQKIKKGECDKRVG
jgi:hypothetical protein